MRVELRENGTCIGIYGDVHEMFNGRLVITLDCGAVISRDLRDVRLVSQPQQREN